jgi:hypothetical protein
MRKYPWLLAVLLSAATALAACTAAVAPAVDPADIQSTVDAVLTANAPVPTSASLEPTAVSGPSFEAAAYRYAVAGFEFDYPAGWAVGPIEQQSRGGITAFTSWERPTDVLPNETPAGETRMDAVVQLWDPKGDLEAFVEQRSTAWDASGIAVTPQEEWTLADGRPAKSFLLQASNGAQSYVFFTTLGDKYLVLSGEGDLALLAEIAHTVRPTPLDVY